MESVNRADGDASRGQASTEAVHLGVIRCDNTQVGRRQRLRHAVLVEPPSSKQLVDKPLNDLDFFVRRAPVPIVRDRHLIFHGCVPCDKQGQFLPMIGDGQPLTGRAMFEAINKNVGDFPTELDLTAAEVTEI